MNIKAIAKKLAFYEPLDRLVSANALDRYANDFRRNLLVSARPNHAKKLAAPIFVVGCGHSGTSVMLAILDNHSQVYGVPEESGVFFRSFWRRLAYFQQWDRSTAEAKKSRWAEKTPRHIYKLDAILKYYPDCKIILMLRDGRDVACSLKERYGDFERGVRRWTKDNEAGRQFWSHPQVLVVKYEDLVKQTYITLERIFHFLAEAYEPGIEILGDRERTWYLEKARKVAVAVGAADNHEANRNSQINQPLFDGSGKWLKKMTIEEKALFKQMAGSQLIELGYAETNDW